jgi:hypothetical protein
MKTPSVYLFLGITAALSSMATIARADVVLVQSVESMAQTTQMTATIGDDKVRVDVTPDICTLVDLTTGDVTTITRSQHSYMVMPEAMLKAMGQMALQAAGTLSPNPAPPVATGKKDKINGYDAAEYTFTNGNIKATYWICSNFPDGKAVTDALAKMEKSPMAQLTKGFTPSVTTLPGVPVKTEVDINGQKMTNSLLSASEKTVDPSQYKIPDGFTEVKMPAMPQMPAPPESAPQPGASP